MATGVLFRSMQNGEKCKVCEMDTLTSEYLKKYTYLWPLSKATSSLDETIATVLQFSLPSNLVVFRQDSLRCGLVVTIHVQSPCYHFF